MPDPPARIYEIFPLLCPICGGQMRIIAFGIFSANIRQILEHIKVDCEPPHIAPPPCGALNPRCPNANDRRRSERQVLQYFAGSRVACHAVQAGRI